MPPVNRNYRREMSNGQRHYKTEKGVGTRRFSIDFGDEDLIAVGREWKKRIGANGSPVGSADHAAEEDIAVYRDMLADYTGQEGFRMVSLTWLRSEFARLRKQTGGPMGRL